MGVPAWAGWLALAGILVWIAQAARPLAFTSGGDGPIYFLPLIKAHTDALLDHGVLLRMEWGLGAGWSPAESAQVGFLYPGYLLANLAARLLGTPMAILEVSAALHLGLAAWLCHRLGPEAWSFPERTAYSLLCMLQPAPVLLGQNWHAYLACYPWFLAILFLLSRRLGGALKAPPGLGLCVASILFFWTAHPSMYVYGTTIAALWIVAEAGPRQGAWHLLALGLAQVPMVVPLLFLKSVAGHATADWIQGRDASSILLAFGQTLRTWVQGALFGNLADSEGMSLWSGRFSASGVGMFFAWPLLMATAGALRKGRILLVLLSLFCVMLLGVASFPWLHHLAVGPWASFRWTWKLSLFVAPMGILMLTRQAPGLWGRSSAWSSALPVFALALLSGLVTWRGLDFDLVMPPQQRVGTLGLKAVLAGTKAGMAKARISPDSKVALVAIHGTRWPLLVWGFTGNAPLLSGCRTLAIYEPLEPATSAERHLNQSVPWRQTMSEAEYRSDPTRWDATFRKLGVRFLLTNTSGLFPAPRSTVFVDAIGRSTWIKDLEPGLTEARPSFPGLDLLPGGCLLSAPGLPRPPDAPYARTVRWRIRPDGRWMGTPSLFPLWVTGLSLVFGLATVAMNGWWKRWVGRSATGSLPADNWAHSDASPTMR